MTYDLLYKLFLSHSVVRRTLNTAFKKAEYKWKLEHLVFLAAIPAGKGIPRKYVATAIFGGDLTTMRRILTELEKDKLIQLKREAEDRRHLRIHITGKGLEALASLNSLALNSLRDAMPRDRWEADSHASSRMSFHM